MNSLQVSELVNPVAIRGLVEESKVPVVFSGCIGNWDILSWSLEKWAEILGEKQMPFRSNAREADQELQWESRCQTVHLTMQQFIQNCKLDPTRWFYFDYKHMEEWFSESAAILESVTWDSLGFPERTGKDSTLWIGSRGAHTPCHLDTYGYNLVAQIHGRKQWILFPPEAYTSMLPTRVPYEESSIYSSRNFNYPHPNMAEDLQGAEPRVITLNPGDVLFVPHHWWHYVENIDTAVSVNTWIPLETDNNERVNESLVSLFIAQICKDLANSSTFLNPNEVDLIDCPLTILMQRVQNSVESLIKPSEAEQDAEPKAKKPMLSFEHQKDSTSEKLTVPTEVCGNVVRTVPKCSHSDFQDLLAEKRKVLEKATQKHPKESSKAVEQNASDILIQRVINAFCHPDVISLVKTKIMSETVQPNSSNC